MQNFSKMLSLFSKDGKDFINETNIGLEREGLRVFENGKLSSMLHSRKWGHPLTHEFITTDFSEAQLELITPPRKYEAGTLEFLDNLLIYVSKTRPNELLWPSSMPSPLPAEKKLPIAYYGDSESAKKKVLYRKGLRHRYGGKMQMISGIHYNFSFTSKFWDFLYKESKSKLPKDEFISEGYFNLMRNFVRFRWLNTYLFGATPAIDRTFLAKKPAELRRHRWRTYYGEHATSLRTSNLGYTSKVQSNVYLCYNSLNNFVNCLHKATTTAHPEYQKFEGEQLNSNILQIPNEYYAPVRPKQETDEKTNLVEALKTKGVKYIEVRSVDINPFTPAGIDDNYLKFLKTFLYFCFFKESPEFTAKEKQNSDDNQNKVALYGRQPGLTLRRGNSNISFTKWANELLEEMGKVAKILGTEAVLAEQIAKIADPELTPSAQVLHELKRKRESFLKFNIALAKEHKRTLLDLQPNEEIQQALDAAREKSFVDEENVGLMEDFILSGYEDMELSTQIIIREATKRHVEVEILDRKDNFIRLKKGKKVEFIKQATKTGIDSYMSFLIMENKHVSKIVLREKGVRVPNGDIAYSIEDGLAKYDHFKDMSLVIKPVSTNFGIGINFVNPKDFESYKKGLDSAFSFDSSVIIEEFIPGDEYRFLVIAGKVEGIVRRVPANVVGDGEHTIRHLVMEKNHNPKSYKTPDKYIRMGQIEKDVLAEQGYGFNDIPKAGEQVFLRKNSNVMTGGDPIDYTDEVNPAYKEIAVRAAAAAAARISGIDMMIQDIAAEPKEDNHGIIEINFNPALLIHRYPYSGGARDVGKPVLDLLGF